MVRSPSASSWKAATVLLGAMLSGMQGSQLAIAQPLWAPVAGKSPADCAIDRSASLVPESCVLMSFEAANRLADAGVGTGFDPDASGRFYRVDRMVRRGPDDVSVFGALEGDPLRRFQLTLGTGSAIAWMQDARGTWEVRPGLDGLHTMYRVEDRATRVVDYVPGHDTGVLVPWVDDPSTDGSLYPAAGDPAPVSQPTELEAHPAAYEITVLVAYTSVVKTRLGTTGLATRVQAAQDWLNQALVNSGHPEITVRVVGTFETVYTPAASMTTDVERLLNPVDGQLDDLLTQRVTAGADLVHLLVPDQTDACGIAYMPHDLRPDLGIGLSGVSCPVSTFAHEIGHNFGMGHDTYVTTTDNWWPWAYGYIDPDFRFRTIMAYANRCFDAGRTCIAIQYFSDPDRSYQGYPTGIPFASGVRSADNVRVLEDMAGNVADNSRYLHPACEWTPAPGSISVTSTISSTTQATFRATLSSGSGGCLLERVRLELAVGTGSSAPTYPIGTHEISAAPGEQVQLTSPFTISSAALPVGTYRPRVLIVRRGYYWSTSQNVSLTSGVAVDRPAHFAEGVTVSAPWPNPSSGPVRVSLSGPHNAFIPVSVYDALGRRIHSSVVFVPAAASVDWTLESSGLPTGTYFVQVSGARRALPFTITR